MPWPRDDVLAYLFPTYQRNCLGDVPTNEYGRSPTITSEIDEYSLPYPSGFILDGCTIIGTDRTEGGISIASTASGQFGSGAATATLTVGAGGTITLNGTASGTASSSSAYVGNGSESGNLKLGYPDNHRLYDLVLAVSHPGDQGSTAVSAEVTIGLEY